jgi:hypothetical protein
MADLQAVVTRLMEERGMSLRALAKAVHHDPSYISKALRGIKPCGAALARAIDGALEADGDVVRAATRSAPSAAPLVTEDYVPPELADYFAAQLAGHYAADRFLGPGSLIPVARSQYELLCDVAGSATRPVRDELWSIAAGFAALLGWLYQDAGDLEESARWHDVMIERAHRSRDPQLVGFSLHCKAMLHADMGDGRGVLDLTGAGLEQRGLIPKARVLLLQQAAHGWSMVGGSDATAECDRLLGEAASLMGDINDAYPWGACKAPRYIDVQRATVCTRLGQHREAARLWEEIIPDLPASSRRDRGVFAARHAQALAGMGEPGQAVSIVQGVVQVAAQSGSARMRSELTAVRKRMEPWRGQSTWRELEEALAALPGLRKGVR